LGQVLACGRCDDVGAPRVAVLLSHTVAQELLDGANVVMGFEEVGSKTMVQGVAHLIQKLSGRSLWLHGAPLLIPFRLTDIVGCAILRSSRVVYTETAVNATPGGSQVDSVQECPIVDKNAFRMYNSFALRNQKRPDLFLFDNPLALRYRVATGHTRKVYELRTPIPSRTARLP